MYAGFFDLLHLTLVVSYWSESRLLLLNRERGVCPRHGRPEVEEGQ